MRAAIALGCLIACLHSPLSHANGSTIRLGAVELPPFSDPTLLDQGAYVELVRAAARMAGWDAHVEFLPPARIRMMLNTGALAGSFPHLRRPEREKQFLHSAPLGRVHTRILVASGSALQSATPEAIAGKRLCRPRGALHPDAIEQRVADHRLEVVEVSNLNVCLRLLQLGRADFVAVNAVTAWFEINGAGLAWQDFRVLDPAVATVTHHLLLSRQHPGGAEMMSRFDVALRSLQRNEGWRAIMQRRLPPEVQGYVLSPDGLAP